jgi:RNA polymerase sigma-70 factor (ECF subfamily)
VLRIYSARLRASALQSNLVNLSDVELLHAIAAHDEAALACLYDRYRLILFGLLLRILNSREEAEDVLQEVFLQIWRRAGNFDEGRGQAFTWMVTLARSRAIDRLRVLAARQRLATSATHETAEVSDAVADAAGSEQREIVAGALAQIPDEQRRTLMLAYFEGLTQSEIATRLGAPLGTVKTRMRSGMIKLRELLADKVQSFYFQ